ncbi:hypothetical protein [Parasphingorhabdus sp.]|uniref:hypothetical protein n=1 Tax=Parasphingorhabdus sp. TaxID=2709688 RepID=UPI003A955BC4
MPGNYEPLASGNRGFAGAGKRSDGKLYDAETRKTSEKGRVLAYKAPLTDAHKMLLTDSLIPLSYMSRNHYPAAFNRGKD